MKPLRIFVVDDDRDFAESLAEACETQGHEVEVAYSGEEAVRRLAAADFDLTFMDVKLPGMNGVESFFEIRKIKPAAKVVMMTAHSVEQLLKQAIDNGALGILHKPFALSELHGTLESLMPTGVVLVVDDDPEFAESVAEFLTDYGYKVKVARDGKEAVEQVLAASIDVLVLDLRLPVLSGLEVYLELKKLGRTVPTVLVTGYADEQQEDIDLLRSMAVSGCLLKPFDPQDLRTALASVIAGDV